MKPDRFTEEQVIGDLKEHELGAKTVDPKLRDRLLALARERRRFGYRRLLIFLRPEGFVLNHKPQANFPHLPRGLAARLQHRAAPFAHRLADAGRPCRPVLAATGPRRCARRWLRALARCRPPVYDVDSRQTPAPTG